MKKCAFLTLDTRGDYFIDDEHAIRPLEALGWQVSTLSWRQTGTPWHDFDVVVVRSTWDYWNDVRAFLDTLRQIDDETRLANPLDIIHWNLEKTYLVDLESKGVGIVPTVWPDSVHAATFSRCFSELGTDQLVIKPVVGANGDDAFRITAGEAPQRLEEICSRFAAKRGLVQTFMPNILTEGEYSLFYFNGEFSHAILKTPKGSEFRSQEEHGGEIRLVTPESKLHMRGQKALAALSKTPLYARVDFVRDELDDFLVMEFELIEPSMYLRTDPDAPGRFAQAIDNRFRVSSR
jgi:glutathione synthase/RimK-type ligase-like ATP-grasp enzyme